MLRVLVVSALVGLVAAGGLRHPTSYKQQLEVVLDAKTLLAKRLNTKTDFDLFKPFVHYVLLLAVPYKRAKFVKSLLRGNTDVEIDREHYLNSLTDYLPEVLLNPAGTLNELNEMLSKTLKKLQPLSDLLEEVCEDVSDFECNKLVDKQIASGDEYDVSMSALVLESANELATLLLSKDQRLKEVAQSLDVIPYLLGNVDDNLQLIGALVNHLITVDRK